MNKKPSNFSEEKLEKTIVVVGGGGAAQANKKSSSQPFLFALKKNSPEDSLKRYKVINTLEENSVETIKYAEDTFLRREVLLKTFQKPKSLSTVQEFQFLQFTTEAKVTGLLEHPNILPLYDKQKLSDKLFYFTLRKISGKTLSQILIDMEEGVEEFDSNRLLTIFLKVCDALSYSHSQGYVHQNVSSKDIIIGEYGEVYITNWGFAGKIGKINKEQIEWFQKNVENRQHLAPEQKEANNRTKIQSDIFALGILLENCFLKGIPADIEAIIIQAIQSQWSKRYSSVQEISDDIENYSKNLRVSVREYTPLEIVSKWIARNLKALFAFVLVILVVTFVFFKTSAENQQQLKDRYKDYFNQAKDKQKKYSEHNIQYFFSARNDLKVVISYVYTHFNKSSKSKLEDLYKEIGSSLIKKACDAHAYLLAKKIAQLFVNEETIKEKALQFIKEERENNENKRKQTNNDILKKYKQLKLKLLRGKIFDLKKEEDKLILKLSRILRNNQKLFFIKINKELKQLNQKELQNKEFYYKFLIRAFAQTKESKATKRIFSLFKSFKQYITNIFPEERTVEDIQFLVTLIYAMDSSCDILQHPIKEELEKLYSIMQDEEIFKTETIHIYQKLEISK